MIDEANEKDTEENQLSKEYSTNSRNSPEDTITGLLAYIIIPVVVIAIAVTFFAGAPIPILPSAILILLILFIISFLGSTA
jgi:hypothetical protein